MSLPPAGVSEKFAGVSSTETARQRGGGVPGEQDPAERDIVVIGASAGGVEALRQIVANLPADLQSTLFVVLHLPAGGTSVLPSILDRAGPLPARAVADGQRYEPGTIYVGVPDHHVRLDDGLMRLEGGPRENGHRPAIDPLFRSAAELADCRTVGVILSGALDDGTRGLRTIKAQGGTTIVQDPETALHPGMPRAAIRHVAPDRVLAPDEIASAIAELSNEVARTRHNMRQRDEMSDRDQVAEQATDEQPGDETGLTCPECGGAIWQREDEGVVSFHCRVGHAYAADTFISEQSRTAEAALWAGLRLLEERAVLMRRLSERFAEHAKTSARFEHKAEQLEGHATELTHVLRQVTGSATPEFVSAED